MIFRVGAVLLSKKKGSWWLLFAGFGFMGDWGDWGAWDGVGRLFYSSMVEITDPMKCEPNTIN